MYGLLLLVTAIIVFITLVLWYSPHTALCPRKTPCSAPSPGHSVVASWLPPPPPQAPLCEPPPKHKGAGGPGPLCRRPWGTPYRMIMEREI